MGEHRGRQQTGLFDAFAARVATWWESLENPRVSLRLLVITIVLAMVVSLVIGGAALTWTLRADETATVPAVPTDYQVVAKAIGYENIGDLPRRVYTIRYYLYGEYQEWRSTIAGDCFSKAMIGWTLPSECRR